MGIYIWKRFGPRSAYQYLHLPETYTIGSKPKKKKQVFLKGGPGYIYKQPPTLADSYKRQQLFNSGHSGPWKHFYGGPKDTRSFRWSAKAPNPVPTTSDPMIEEWGKEKGSKILIEERAAIKHAEDKLNQKEIHEAAVLESARKAAETQHARSVLRASVGNIARLRSGRKARTQFAEQKALQEEQRKKEKELKEVEKELIFYRDLEHRDKNDPKVRKFLKSYGVDDYSILSDLAEETAKHVRRLEDYMTQEVSPFLSFVGTNGRIPVFDDDTKADGKAGLGVFETKPEATRVTPSPEGEPLYKKWGGSGTPYQKEGDLYNKFLRKVISKATPENPEDVMDRFLRRAEDKTTPSKQRDLWDLVGQYAAGDGQTRKRTLSFSGTPGKPTFY